MSQQQNQLKRELLRQREIIEDLQVEIEQKDNQMIDVQRENQRLHMEIEEIREKMIKFDELMKEQIRLAVEQEKQKNQGRLGKQNELEQELDYEKQVVKKQKHMIEEKEDMIQKYKQVLKEMSQKYDIGEVQEEIQNYKEDRVMSIKQMQKLSMDYNQLSNQMNDILAENKLLRKMAKVPENFGFDLTKVKMAEQEQASDFKQQMKYLEKEIKELEIERTQLRYRLRTISSLYSNKKDQRYLDLTDDQYLLLDEYVMLLKQGIEKLPVTDKTAEYWQEIQNLRGQIEVYEKQAYNGNNMRMNYKESNANNNQITGNNTGNAEQNEELKEYLKELVGQLQQQNGQQQQQQHQQQKGKRDEYMGQAPVVLPDAMGGYEDVREGFSHKFNSKLTIDFMDLYAETGFDQVGAKYEIGHLQLQNIECIKLLQVKQKQYEELKEDLGEVKAKYKVLVGEQNIMFKQHYQQIQQREYQYKQMQQENQELIYKVKELESQKKVMEEMVDSQHNTDIQDRKYQESIKRIAILDVNLIKLSRKYEALEEEYKQLRELYYGQEKENLLQEEYLVKRVNYLMEWKQTATEQLRVLLKQQQNSIDLNEHRVLVERYELMQDRYSTMILKESELREQMSNMESEGREKNELKEELGIVKEEYSELMIEYELISKRLETRDKPYYLFKQVMQRIVDRINQASLQVKQMLEQVDVAREGRVARREFMQVVALLGVVVEPYEEQSIFSFLDIDNRGSIQIEEFLRKLARAGVVIMKKEDQLIYEIYKAIQDSNMTLQQAFRVFDSDGDNLISKKDMKETFGKMQKLVEEKALEYVFNLADTSGDGLINYDEFTTLFNKIARSSQNSNKEQLDWKYQIVLTLHKVLEEHSISVMKLFEMLDQDASNQVDQEEFIKIFTNMRLDIEKQQLVELFQDIDAGRNQTVSYQELIDYIQKAQKEQFRIQKMESLNRQNQKEQDQQDMEWQQLDTEDKSSQLEMRIQMMMIKEKNLQNRVEVLNNQVELGHKASIDSNRLIKQLQDQLVRTKEEYYKQKEKVHALLEKVNVNMTNQEGHQLTVTNDKLHIENTQLRAGLNTFKQLNELSNTQNKSLYLLLQKQRYEVFIYKETIRGLQSTGDKQVLIGKLYHEVMIKKQQLVDIYRKYDQQFSQIQSCRAQVLVAENTQQTGQVEIIRSEEVFNQKLKALENQVTQLKIKIIPTINVQRIEQVGQMVKELTGMKTALEIQNKKIRQQNVELSIDLDYFKVYQETLRDLEQRLKKSHNDELSQQLIDMSIRLKEYKLSELKAKREAQMAVEKEEYYQRLNRQQLQANQTLEHQLAQWDVKYAQREEFWLNRYHQSTKLLFNSNNNNNNTNNNLNTIQESETTKNSRQSQILQQQQQKKSQSQQQQQNKIPVDQSYQQQWDNKQKGYEKIIEEKNEEIKRLEKREERRVQGREEDYDLQTSKLAMAAQKTIQTLQGMMKDQKEELESKDRRIEEIIRQGRTHKEKDSLEIQRLNNIVLRMEREQNEKQREEEQMVVPGARQGLEDMHYIANLQKLLGQKDHKLEDFSQRIKTEIALRKQSQQQEQQLREQIDVYLDQIEKLKLNNSHQKLQKELEQTKRMVKLRDKEIEGFQTSIKNLQEEFYKSMDKQNADDKKYQDVYGKLLKQNVNSSELETGLQLAKQKLVELNSKVKEAYQQIEVVKQGEKAWKDKCVQLELELKNKSHQKQEDKMEQFLQKNQKKVLDVEELQMHLEMVKLENQKLKQTHFKNIFDESGYLKSEKGAPFANARQIRDRLVIYMKNNYSLDIYKHFHKDKYKLKEFYQQWELLGVKMKERDKNIFKAELVDSNDEVETQKLFQFLKGTVNKQIDCKIQTAGPKSISQAVPLQSQIKQQPQPQNQKLDKEKEQLQKNNEILKKQALEHRKEREQFDKQLQNWKDKCQKLEKELRGHQNQVQSYTQNLHQELNNNPVIQQLKDKIYKLEEDNTKLTQVIDVKKNAQIFQQSQQIDKLQQQVQKLNEENAKIINKQDSFQKNKDMPNNGQNMEKDLIIQRLKEKLDINRITLEGVEQKLFEQQKQNFELKFIKENFDLQVDRYQSRIQELEQAKQYYEKTSKRINSGLQVRK